jgi:hypothetical protein
MSINVNTPPLACDPLAIPPERREVHARLTAELAGSVRAVHELPNGYALLLSDSASDPVQIAGFIADERLCCPFLQFSLQVGPVATPMQLSLTGPEGVKEFLQAELGDLLKG